MKDVLVPDNVWLLYQTRDVSYLSKELRYHVGLYEYLCDASRIEMWSMSDYENCASLPTELAQGDTSNLKKVIKLFYQTTLTTMIFAFSQKNSRAMVIPRIDSLPEKALDTIDVGKLRTREEIKSIDYFAACEVIPLLTELGMQRTQQLLDTIPILFGTILYDLCENKVYRYKEGIYNEAGETKQQ